MVESSLEQVGAGEVVGAAVDGTAVGAGVVGMADGADVDGAGVAVGASVLPRKPPHAQHWRLAVKSSSS